MKMQCLARAARWGKETGAATAGISAASRPSFRSSEAKARPPTPRAVLTRKSRRVRWRISFGLISFAGHEFVEVQQHLRDVDPGGVGTRELRLVGLQAFQPLEFLQAGGAGQ